MKIIKPELFQIALKLILVGTGIVLSPHKYFQFDRTLKNAVVNSESAFWDFLWKAPFGIFPKRLLEALGTKEAPLGGAKGGRPWRVELHGAPHGTPFCFILYVNDIKWGYFWYL